MAIAQRQPARIYARPAPRTDSIPAARPPASGRSRAAQTSNRTLFANVVPTLLLTGALIAYLAGYATMTGANYQRVQLKRQLLSVKTQHQLLSTFQIKARDREQIEQWAVAHDMERPQEASVTVALAARKGQQAP